MTKSNPKVDPKADPNVTFAENQSNPPLDYVILIAFTIATVALATDVMLPALGIMGQAFDLANINDTQYVVSVFFIGFDFGDAWPCFVA